MNLGLGVIQILEFLGYFTLASVGSLKATDFGT